MPSTYDPDPTATQAPAAQPDPDNDPQLSLPVSGDGATAASVGQPFKALGDTVSWLKSPRAAANAWIQAMRKYKNARLQDRFTIDHLGFPMGRLVKWTESWRGRGNRTTTGSEVWLDSDQIWNVTVTAGGTGGQVRTIDFLAGQATPGLTRMLLLNVGSGASDESKANTDYQGLFTLDNAFAVEFDVWLGTTGTTAV